MSRRPLVILSAVLVTHYSLLFLWNFPTVHRLPGLHRIGLSPAASTTRRNSRGGSSIGSSVRSNVPQVHGIIQRAQVRNARYASADSYVSMHKPTGSYAPMGSRATSIGSEPFANLDKAVEIAVSPQRSRYARRRPRPSHTKEASPDCVRCVATNAALVHRSLCHAHAAHSATIKFSYCLRLFYGTSLLAPSARTRRLKRQGFDRGGIEMIVMVMETTAKAAPGMAVSGTPGG